MNFSAQLKDIREGLEGWLDKFDSVCKTVVFLDDDSEFLKIIKYKCRAHNDELVTISNVAEFKAFTHSPSREHIAKLFIDINLPNDNGIDLAKSMKLAESTERLYFVSEAPPTNDQKTQIFDLGGQFLLKKDLVKTVIFPEEIKE
jgi:DNA-binding response OmpR family regulator